MLIPECRCDMICSQLKFQTPHLDCFVSLMESSCRDPFCDLRVSAFKKSLFTAAMQRRFELFVLCREEKQKGSVQDRVRAELA